jgi:hypothetical protein
MTERVFGTDARLNIVLADVDPAVKSVASGMNTAARCAHVCSAQTGHTPMATLMLR